MGMTSIDIKNNCAIDEAGFPEHIWSLRFADSTLMTVVHGGAGRASSMWIALIRSYLEEL